MVEIFVVVVIFFIIVEWMRKGSISVGIVVMSVFMMIECGVWVILICFGF